MNNNYEEIVGDLSTLLSEITQYPNGNEEEF